MNSGGKYSPSISEIRCDQHIRKTGLDRLRSRFARDLHFPEKPQPDQIHHNELDHIETALRSFVSGDTVEDLGEQLEGQRTLVKKLTSNLKDNRSKLRSVLADLKASRKRLSMLEGQMNGQKKDLFEKSMTIDSQRVEINILRNEIGAVLELKQQFSDAQSRLSQMQIENQNLRDEISNLRQLKIDQNIGQAREETLRALNQEIEQLKRSQADRQAEIGVIKSENEALKTKQTALEKEKEGLRRTESNVVSLERSPNDLAKIDTMSSQLHQAEAREEIMNKRLDILRRDLDIINQTNEMLRGRLAELENADTRTTIPKQVVGF